ncbi:MAG: hypothetical protein E6Q27_08265 [Aeromicrobium sp.]|nr:MAG: hypothetical protein E6Q27_08265 [Aeromicrobium sp.]
MSDRLDAHIEHVELSVVSERQKLVLILLACAAAFGVGLRVSLPLSLTPAVVIGVALAPVWLSSLSQFAHARLITVGAFLAVFNGLVLTALASTTERIDSGERLALTFMILTIFVGAGVLLWARTLIGAVPVVLLFSVAAAATISRSNAGVMLNPWKFGYSIPITLFVLALAWQSRKLWVELLALAVLAVIGMANDSRSYFAMLLVAGVVIVWQRLATKLAGKSLMFSVAGLGIGAIAVYLAASQLALRGALGEQAAARTQMQMERSGSLLLGGRPELSATLALMRERIWGYGLGRMPNWDDVATAKTGMARAGYDPNNGYVERYMFGGRFEVHSLFGDFWIHLGIVGLALIVYVGVVCLVGVALRVRANVVSALEVFIAINMVWNIAFSPLYSSIPLATVGIAVLLWPRGSLAAVKDDEESPGDSPRVSVDDGHVRAQFGSEEFRPATTH